MLYNNITIRDFALMFDIPGEVAELLMLHTSLKTKTDENGITTTTEEWIDNWLNDFVAAGWALNVPVFPSESFVSYLFHNKLI